MSFLNSYNTDANNQYNEDIPPVQPVPNEPIETSLMPQSHIERSSRLGADLTIKGDVISDGEIHIEGKIEGDIKCAAIMIDEGGKITGSVIADDVIIGGEVLGTVRGLNVTLRSAAHVEGDIVQKSLAMEQGAFFEGCSRNAEDPMSDSSQTP